MEEGDADAAILERGVLLPLLMLLKVALAVVIHLAPLIATVAARDVDADADARDARMMPMLEQNAVVVVVLSPLLARP